jgi:hypothetical protein
MGSDIAEVLSAQRLAGAGGSARSEMGAQLRPLKTFGNLFCVV